MKAAAIFALATSITLGGCSGEHASAPAEKWVAASALPQPAVPYMPKPVITARERSEGHWVWHPENSPAKAMTFDQMLRELTAAKSFNPEPLILFKFARQADRSEWMEARSRIADALGCSSSRPCIEGVPEEIP